MTDEKDNYAMQTITLPPPTVGYYKRDDIQLMMVTRPNWFQQKMTNWFFGWKWHDDPQVDPMTVTTKTDVPSTFT